MANRKLTGWTKEEKLRQKSEHPASHEYSFENYRCLAEIINQPDWYEGPVRFCKKYTLKKDNDGRYNRCRKHNGAGHKDDSLEGLDQAEEGNTKAMTHGMYAEDENLRENWSDADQVIYDKVMSWAEDYGFEEGSPEFMQLESLAMSRVREMRSEKFINQNGEIVTREQFNPETGETSEWEEVHPIVDAVRLKKQTILKMMKELGLTPKAKSSMDESEAKASEAGAIAEVASQALDKEDEDYDPEQFT